MFKEWTEQKQKCFFSIKAINIKFTASQNQRALFSL